jgi:hypothetical protein
MFLLHIYHSDKNTLFGAWLLKIPTRMHPFIRN